MACVCRGFNDWVYIQCSASVHQINQCLKIKKKDKMQIIFINSMQFVVEKNTISNLKDIFVKSLILLLIIKCILICHQNQWFTT